MVRRSVARPLLDTRTDEEIIPNVRPRPATLEEREAMAREAAEELQAYAEYEALRRGLLAGETRTAEEDALLRQLMPELYLCEDPDCPDCHREAQRVAAEERRRRVA